MAKPGRPWTCKARWEYYSSGGKTLQYRMLSVKPLSTHGWIELDRHVQVWTGKGWKWDT